MTNTEHSPKAPHSTGIFATLRASLRVPRTGAPSVRPRLVFIAAVAALGVVCLAPTVASASFTRPFIRQITAPFTEPGGVAVNSTNDLWVGDLKGPPFAMDEFSPAYEKGNEPLGSFAIPACVEAKGEGDWEESSCLTETTKYNAKGDPAGNFEKPGAPGSVAIESATTGDLYVTSPNGEHDVVVLKPGGEFVEAWGFFGYPQIAIDNNPETDLADTSHCVVSECTVYVSDGANEGVLKLDSKGTPESFTASESYIKGNKITGYPAGEGCMEESFSMAPDNRLGAVAVDGEGDIYVMVPEGYCKGVLEYEASGKYVRRFSLESNEALCSPGGSPLGLGAVAVDPVSHHLLVEAGCIIEFEVEGPNAGKVVAKITETSEGKQLEAPQDMTVDSLGDVYVVDGERHAVDAWGPGAYFPTVTLAAASERTGTSAVLNGSVDPAQGKNPAKAPLSECYFQYTEEAVYEQALAKNEEGGFPKANLKVEQAPCEPDAAEVQKKSEEAEKAGKPEATFAVQADIKGLLKSGETYRYRLVASTEEAKLGGTAHTEVFAFTAPHAPRIESSAADNISSTFAELDAQIDPLGASTSYHFEYDTRPYAEGEGSHGTSVPVPDEAIGAGGALGDAAESVSEQVGPLTPGTTYYYRVVAQNAQGVGTGAVCGGEPALDCTFATLPEAVPGLADGRAYELVTPDQKQGGSDMFAQPVSNDFENDLSTGTPSQTGEGFLLEAFSLFGPFPGSYHAAYAFHRDPEKGEWTYTALTEPSLGTQSVISGGALFDPVDLSRVGVNLEVGSALDQAGEQRIDLVGPTGGPYTKVHADPPTHEVGGNSIDNTPQTTMVGASRDLSHVVLDSKTPEDGGTNIGCPGSAKVKHGDALCEWDGGYETLENGEVKPELKLVNVNSEGELVSACGAQLGPGSSSDRGGEHQAVSADGSKVFFTAPTPTFSYSKLPGCETEGATPNAPAINPPQLYARIDGTSTLEVSVPEPGVTEAGSKEPHERPVLYPAEFVGASEDGGKVFFVTESWLTANHSQVHDPELYECEIVEETVEEKTVPNCRLTRVSIPSGAAGGVEPNEGGQVFGVQAVASEGTAVYFLAFGALAPGASKLGVGEVDTFAPVNLYRYQTETSTIPARMTYVATVSTNNRSDQPDCSEFGPCAEENWYTTPDGRYLLFASEVDLTSNAHTEGSDCHIPGGEFASGNCAVLYRYDARASEEREPPIVCVSCDPVGASPTGNALFTRSVGGGPVAVPVRAMSEDGSYVFFDTPTPLLPQATNGTLDVYEWHDGRISLISSGSQAGPSYFLGYSSYVTPGGETIEGGNVFIGTHARLVPQDTNNVGNIYDARICVAESPCIKPPPGETALCEGSACQSSPVEPLDATPTSLTFSGPGDVSSEALPPARAVTKKANAKCKKGFVKSKGKCVKKSKKKSKAKKAGDKRRAK
jgi:hypothetical protein